MSCTVHDYEYVRNHLDEFKFTMDAVKKEIKESFSDAYLKSIPQSEYDRCIEISFYKKLIDNREMSVPERCKACPFHRVEFNMIGQLCDQCDINVNTFVGNLFFAESKTRPDWCPLGR